MNHESPNADTRADLSQKGIWQPLPNESADAYAAFVVYLELGFDATLAQVAAKTGRSYPAIRHLSCRHGWMERATAWRQHTAAAVLSSALIENVPQQKLWSTRHQVVREQQWELSQSIAAFCHQALGKLLSDPEAKVAPYELAPLLRLASQTAHQAIAQVPAADEISDPDSDPFVLQARDHLQKVCEDKRKRDAERAAQSLQPQPPPPASS